MQSRLDAVRRQDSGLDTHTTTHWPYPHQLKLRKLATVQTQLSNLATQPHLKLSRDTESLSTSSKKAARAGAMGVVSTEGSMNSNLWSKAGAGTISCAPAAYACNVSGIHRRVHELQPVGRKQGQELSACSARAMRLKRAISATPSC